MILQALDYEEAEKGKRPKFLQEFFDSTKGVFQTESVQDLVGHLYNLRCKNC